MRRRSGRQLIPIERHGRKPSVKEFNNTEAEITEIRSLIGSFPRSGYNSMGIICKTQKEADRLYEYVKEHPSGVYLLNTQSAAFVNGVVIASAHMSKGLEFDQVIVPFVSSGNYKTEMDRRMLYIACTRAMHQLDLTFTGKRTEFL